MIEQAEKHPAATDHNSVRLADFLRERSSDIVSEWESFAATLTPASDGMSPLALRDHIQEILAFIADDIVAPQTGAEQVLKSRGEKAKSLQTSIAETHAALRLAGGFNIDQMVSEYRALRASVIKLWSAENTEPKRADLVDLTRFNESIDQTLAESVSHYTHKVNYSKDLFLGILSHDLRTPLSVISMSAELLRKLGSLNERQTMLASQIYESTSRVTQIVNDLLDVTRSRFGSALPINRTLMDMGAMSRQLVDEMHIAHPTRVINLEASGDLKGEWDKARIGQIFSNLLGNAIQYGFKDTPISVVVKGRPDEVELSVHNEGPPIPPDKIGTIFDSLARVVHEDGAQSEPSVNLGLGLYITKDIVTSHDGSIDVASTAEYGTTFTVQLPRLAPVQSPGSRHSRKP